jgi:hypothetical protein
MEGINFYHEAPQILSNHHFHPIPSFNLGEEIHQTCADLSTGPSLLNDLPTDFQFDDSLKCWNERNFIEKERFPINDNRGYQI